MPFGMGRFGCWALVLLLAALARPIRAQDDGYHILLTNDDGIDSPGLQALATELRAVGQVHVVAPCGEQSGSSMSLALGQELRLEARPREDGTVQHCVTTSPAGTVMLALDAVAPPGGFDLVVSGINRGANVGTASHISGTVGAAMMGALHGIPAVAASAGGRGDDYGYAARWVTAFVRKLKARPAMPGVVLSINFPEATREGTEGVAVRPMGGMHFQIGFDSTGVEGATRRYRARVALATEAPAGSDTEAYLRRMITVTPLAFDWTARSVLDALERWGLTADVDP